MLRSLLKIRLAFFAAVFLQIPSAVDTLIGPTSFINRPSATIRTFNDDLSKSSLSSQMTRRCYTAASRAAQTVQKSHKRGTTSVRAQTSSSTGSGTAGQPDRVVPLKRDIILAMLSRMTSYFESMVDPRTNRFYYRCLPESGRRIHGHCPIRDLGSAWDTATLLTFLRGESESGSSILPADFMSERNWQNVSSRLSAAVKETIEAYSGSYETFEDSFGRQCVFLPSKVLREPSNIAHSAFLVLATVGAFRLGIPNSATSDINKLVNGILSMQQDNGAFAIQFGSDDISRGIEFYPGEAMLALMDAYDASPIQQTGHDDNTPYVLSQNTRQVVVPAVEQAFLFYSDYYHRGNVDAHYTSFFGNWQVQCFAKLFNTLQQHESDESENNLASRSHINAATVADYILELCDAIIASTSWQELWKGHYHSLSTVEIACGLEAISEGTLVALLLPSERGSAAKIVSDRVAQYWLYIQKAVQFLAAVQSQVSVGSTGSGGLGHAIHMSEQRLDVTGHAVNALIKVYSVQQNVSPAGLDSGDYGKGSEGTHLAP